MGRLERNRIKRRRRRTVVFSLLLIILFFISGILVTNGVMTQMTGLSPQQDQLSVQNISQRFKKVQEFGLQTLPLQEIQDKVKEWLDTIRMMVGEMIDRI